MSFDYKVEKSKILPDVEIFTPDIEVRFNPKTMSQDSWTIIQQLPKIIQDSGEEGETFMLDIFEIVINKMKTYEKELVE